MKLSFEGQRVLAVVAHPDDAELLCGGTLARARADGAAIGICVLCRGDKGLPPEPVRNLAVVRRREMKTAADLVGATLYWGNSPDGMLADEAGPRQRLIEVYRRFRTSLVLAHAPCDYHPDHRAASALAEAASWFAASRGHVTATRPLEAPPALWWMDTVNMTGFEPGFYIDVSEHVELKRRMLACHKSQLARGAGRDFGPLSETMARQMVQRGAECGAAAAEAFALCRQWKRARAW